MAPKEDMLPPGWEDLDRYVDLLFRMVPNPAPHRPNLHALWNPNAPPSPSSDHLDYFLFGKYGQGTEEGWFSGVKMRYTMLTYMAGKWASSL